MDRFGPRATMLPSTVAIAVMFASLAFLTANVWHLYVVFALIPMLAGAASPLGYSAVIVRRFSHKLGQALGLALMGVGVGATVLPPLAQSLVGGLGWRGAFAALGTITLLVTFPAALVATRGIDGPSGTSGTTPALASLAAAVRMPSFMLMCALFVVIGFISIGVLANLVPMMIDRGLTPTGAAGVAAATGFAAIFGRAGIGFVLDRVHASFVLAAVALSAVVAFILLAHVHGLVVSYIAAMFIGMVVGAEVDFISFLVRRYFDPQIFGRLYGIAFGLFIVGSGTGPLLLGATVDHSGGYRLGLILFAALGLIVALVALALPAYPSLKSDRSRGQLE
jgi:MFS family permease